VILFLLVTVLLTIYLSLYPLEFHSVPLDRNPLLMVLQSWPELTRRSAVDLISNIAFYIPLGVSGRLAIGKYFPD
jgi:hypothetical protein